MSRDSGCSCWAAYVLAWLAFMSSCTDCHGTAQREAEQAVRSMVKRECRY